MEEKVNAIKTGVWTKLVLTACILLAAYHILRAKGRACRRKKLMAGKEQEG